MENKKDKLASKNNNKNAKKASKSMYYESFNKIAKRLKSQGLLNEDNYKKVKAQNENIYSGIFLLSIIIGVALIASKVGFIYFVALLIYTLVTIFFQKRNLNRLCYLHTFGKEVEGELVTVAKIQFMGLNYKYNITFNFIDSTNHLITTYQKNLYLDPKSDKVYKTGDKVMIYYNPNNSKDAIATISAHNCYNLSSATKNN